MLQPLADPSPLGCVDGMDRILTADQAQSKALYVASTPSYCSIPLPALFESKL